MKALAVLVAVLALTTLGSAFSPDEPVRRDACSTDDVRQCNHERMRRHCAAHPDDARCHRDHDRHTDRRDHDRHTDRRDHDRARDADRPHDHARTHRAHDIDERHSAHAHHARLVGHCEGDVDDQRCERLSARLREMRLAHLRERCADADAPICERIARA